MTGPPTSRQTIPPFELKINQNIQSSNTSHHSISEHAPVTTLEMHGSAGFDEFQRRSCVLSFSPLAVDIFSRNIVSPTQQQNNNKRKNNTYENGNEVKRQKRVEPIEIVGAPLVNPFPSGFMSSSAYSSFSESSQSLSPPLTPGAVSLSPYFPNYGLSQSQTHHHQQEQYFQYDMAQVGPRGPLRGFPDQALQPQVSPGVKAQGKAVSAALSYLYEKSLSSVRRWRENGLTVQLFYCVVCGLPSDSEQRIKSHIENRHQGQNSDTEKADVRLNNLFSFTIDIFNYLNFLTELLFGGISEKSNKVNFLTRRIRNWNVRPVGRRAPAS